MSKKLNNFKAKSTHYIVDGKGKLKFITFCPALNQKSAYENMIEFSKRKVDKIGLFESLEYFKYKF